MKSLRILLGLALAAGFIFLFLRQVDFGQLGQSLVLANYGLVAASIPIIILVMLLRAWRWREILSPVRRSSIPNVFRIIVVGYMANSLLPVRLGEIVRAYVYGEEESTSKTSVLATIVVERVFDLLALFVLLGVAAALLPTVSFLREVGGQANLPRIPVLAGVVVVIVGVFLLLLSAAFAPGKLLGIVKRVGFALPKGWRQQGYSLAERFVEGTTVLRNPLRLGLVFSLSLLLWMTDAVMYYIVGLAFALGQPYSVYLTAMSISNLLCVIPAAMAGIGPFDWGMKVTLMFFGVNASLAVAYTIVLHAFIISIIVLLGLAFLWSTKRSLVKILRYATGSKEQIE